MSKVSLKPIDCPKCHAEYDIEYHESINVTLDPEDRDRVIDGTLFVNKCPKCGYEQMVTYPFVYHDMKNKFMLSYGNSIELLHEHNMMKNNEYTNVLKDVLDEKHYGISNYFDLISAISALENGLNFPIVKFVIDYMKHEFIQSKKEEGYDCKVNYICLSDRRDDNGDLLMGMYVTLNGEEDSLSSRFPTELYDTFVESFADKIEKINPYVINSEWIDRFSTSINEEYKDDPWIYYYVRDRHGALHVCVAPTVLDKVLEQYDLVTAYFDDGRRIEGVIESIDHIHRLSIPLVDAKILTIDARKKEYNFLYHHNPNAVVDNDKLLKHLLKYKQVNKYSSKSYLTRYLKKADLYVAYQYHKTKVSGFEELSDITLLGDYSDKFEQREIKSLLKTKGPKVKLAVFTDETKLPANGKYEYFIMKFEDICRLIKADPRYAGIGFNPLDDKVFFPVSRIKDFSHYTHMANANDMKKYLDSLNEEDIELIGKQSIEFIRQVYFDCLTPRDLEAKYNMSKEEVGHILDEGYGNMIALLYEKL